MIISWSASSHLISMHTSPDFSTLLMRSVLYTLSVTNITFWVQSKDIYSKCFFSGIFMYFKTLFIINWLKKSPSWFTWASMGAGPVAVLVIQSYTSLHCETTYTMIMYHTMCILPLSPFVAGQINCVKILKQSNFLDHCSFIILVMCLHAERRLGWFNLSVLLHIDMGVARASVGSRTPIWKLKVLSKHEIG